MTLPPPGIYGDPKVNVDPPPAFYEPEPIRGPTSDHPPHEILRMAIRQALGR